MGSRARAALACIALSSVPASAINIEFDYSFDTGFFDDPARREMMELAASFFTSFTDTLAPITPGGDDAWSVIFNDPSNLSNLQVVENLHVSSDTLVIYAGGASMGDSVLGFGSTGTLFNVTGSDEFQDALLTRGEDNALGPKASDYGVWGGAVSFNSDKDWYFGQTSVGLGEQQHDFLTTAVHEIAHVFGFGQADSWFAQIMELATGDILFTGDASVALYGDLVPLENAGHWQEGLVSFVDGVPQETLMDPTTPAGVRQLMTDLDYAGLSDIGWEVRPVPLPTPFWLLAAALVALHRAGR